MLKVLQTERLILRPFRKFDAQQFYEYAKHPDVGPHAGWKPHESKRESKEIIKNLFMENEVWAIVDIASAKLIGSIGFEPDKRRPGIESRELGYSLAKDFWGKGLMTEAAREIIRYGFEEMNLEIIAICTGPDNSRSARVIEKCGFKYEGTERYCYKVFDGSIRDSKCFSLLRSEWEACSF